MAEISLDDLKRRLLAGRTNPSGADTQNDVYVAPEGDIRVGSAAAEGGPVSKVPRKVFARRVYSVLERSAEAGGFAVKPGRR